MAYVNDYESKLEKITTERAAAYRRLLAGELPSSSNGAQTRLKLEKLKILATGLHRVVAYPATVETQSAFLMKPTGVGDAAASKVDPADTFVAFVCDCEEFMRSGGTICACSLAVAAARFSKGNSHINLDHLLEETAATRRPVGRPRKAEHGSCYGGGGGAAGGGGSSSSGAGRHTPHFYHSTIMSSGALRFHKWRVVVDFEGEKCVGTIVSYRDDYHEERKPYTSKTPFTPVEVPLLPRRRRRVRGVRRQGPGEAPEPGPLRGRSRPGPRVGQRAAHGASRRPCPGAAAAAAEEEGDNSAGEEDT